MSEDLLKPWEEAVRVAEPDDTRKATCDNFVTEYLKDYDPVAAALRMGYDAAFALEYAQRFMMDPYVRQQITKREVDDPNETDEVARKRIRSALWKEANSNGKGSSAAARVAALAKLMSMHGFDAPIKTENTHNLSGAVQFYLPSNGRDPVPVPATPTPPVEAVQ